jgi:HSP20 family protein
MRMLTPYWTTRSLASDLFDEMNRFFDEDNRHASGRIYDERVFDPAYEITETDEHYLMSVDLPGMKQEEIKIEVADNVLVISGERKREATEDQKTKVQRYEKSYGFFKRSFNLPSTIESDQIEAHYENGVLELYLPKAQAAKPRSIEIQSGKGGFFDRLLGTKKNTKELKEVHSNTNRVS